MYDFPKQALVQDQDIICVVVITTGHIYSHRLYHFVIHGYSMGWMPVCHPSGLVKNCAKGEKRYGLYYYNYYFILLRVKLDVMALVMLMTEKTKGNKSPGLRSMQLDAQQWVS